jgi:glycosyltransferase involved in cell wall biosynthesis
MHDFGYVTGGCHVPLGCSQYTANCKICPIAKGKFITANIMSVAQRTRKLLEKNKLAIVAPSSYVKEKISKVVKNDRLYVIGNCYSNEYIGLKNDKDNHSMPILITVGLDTNNHDNKGCSTVIKTFKLLKKGGIKFKYISVGQRYAFAEPNIHEHYIFCEQAELISLYQKSTLCLVPSKYETFSQVSLEAILCGTPVVAYDLTGPRDIISNLENGVLVTSFDEEEYAETVFRILNGNIQIDFNNLNVKNKFKPTSIYNSYSEVYKSLSSQ